MACPITYGGHNKAEFSGKLSTSENIHELTLFSQSVINEWWEWVELLAFKKKQIDDWQSPQNIYCWEPAL